jgi:hypothetical protein
MEQGGLKEAFSKPLLSVIGLKKKEEDPVEHQVAQLVEAIQNLQ